MTIRQLINYKILISNGRDSTEYDFILFPYTLSLYKNKKDWVIEEDGFYDFIVYKKKCEYAILRKKFREKFLNSNTNKGNA